MNSVSNAIPEKIGRYIVREILGRGAMGTVYLAEDPVIGRPVAVKLIQSTANLPVEEQEHYGERFSREAKAAGRLLHPGIVTVFDVGQTEEGLPYLIMEYVKGKTLKNLIGTQELSHEQSLQLGREILEALECAHAQGVVHRDLKPANIIVTDDFHAKIMDFGIAHLSGSELTQTGEMIGTPHFMAPEQIDGRPVDLRTDLFAFGIVFYLLLTGEKPFEGDTFTALTYAIVNKDPIPPERIRSGIPEALSRIVLKCVQKDPGERYGSAREVIQDLISLQSAKPSLEPGSDTVRKLRARPKGRQAPLLPIVSVLAIAVIVPLILLSVYSDRETGTPTVVKPPDPAPAQQAEQVAEPEEPDVESLLAAAWQSFQAGNLEETKQTLETVLKKDPAHPEALKLKDRIANHQLFSEATIALQNKDWDRSQSAIQALLEKDPNFPGAREILEQLSMQQFIRRLPLIFQARHNHTFGGCNGTLILGKSAVSYRSTDHGKLEWRFPQIVDINMKNPNELEMAAQEKGNKNYKFSFPEKALPQADWQRYRKLWLDAQTRR